MRIAVDATAHADIRSGAMRRIVELHTRCAALRSDDEVFLLVHEAAESDVRAATGGVTVVPWKSRGSGPWARAFRHNRALVTWADEHDVDLIHQDTLPLAHPRTTLPTMHDLRFMHGELEAPWSRRTYGQLVLPYRLKQCPAVLTVSDFVADELHEILGLPTSKVRVVPNGVNPARFRSAGDSGVRARLGVAEAPYLLFVGHREYRKNLPLLIRLAPLLRERGLAHRIVIAGRRIPGYSEPEELARTLRVDEMIVFAEDVGDTELADLYAGASVFLMPSLYEGFGLPILEAMAAGVPVVAPTLGPFPEVAGERACVDAHHPGEWVAEIERLTNDAAHRERALEAGLTQVERFTWDAAAVQLAEVYSELTSG